MTKELEVLNKYWEQYKERSNETQITASKKFEITQASFSQYLSGHINMNPMFLLKICRMMGVNPAHVRPSMKCIFGEKKGKRLLTQIDDVLEALRG